MCLLFSPGSKLAANMSSSFSLILFLLRPIFINAQNYKNVSLDSSITANDDNSSWVSPSGEFAFGFRPLADNGLFLLAIWFEKIPDKTIVWYANGNEQVPRGSKVQLTSDDGLVLVDPKGKELWKADRGGAVSYGAMLDTSNFVLVSQNSDDLWESFKQPTDTLLPTQTMEVDSVLYSRQTKSTYSRGRFRLRLLQDGNLVLNLASFQSLTENQYEAYYWSDTFDTNRSNAGYLAVYNESGSIYVVRRSGQIKTLSPQNKDSTGGFYYRATLDYDGVFTKYSYPKTSDGNGSWSIEWSAPDDICLNTVVNFGSGACGYNSYCVLTQEKRPRCECPPKYSFVDPNDRFSGCVPNFTNGCQKDEWRNQSDIYELETLENIDWPKSDYEKLDNYSEQDCRSSCLDDCLCLVAIIREGTCWKKKLPLSNGRYSLSVNGNAIVKVRKGDF